jgi:hypothetical protein
MVLAVFCWAICSRVPTSILTRRCVFPMDEFRQFGSIISVTTDAILALCMSSLQPPGENRVNRVEKIIGSAEKNRVGREPEPQVCLSEFLKFMDVSPSISGCHRRPDLVYQNSSPPFFICKSLRSPQFLTPPPPPPPHTIHTQIPLVMGRY